jgi:hypothetical protein
MAIPIESTNIHSLQSMTVTWPAGRAVLTDSAQAAGKPATDPMPCLPTVALGLPGQQTGRLLADCMPLLRQGRNIYCLDGGNVFDPYQLAELARTAGLEPGQVLDRVFVSRAYTCHQLAEAADILLAPLADPDQRKTPLEPLVIILGIDRLFLDEDLALYERRHLYRRVLECAAWISQHLPLLITFTGDPGSRWIRDLARTVRLLPESERALPGTLWMTTHPQQADAQEGN